MNILVFSAHPDDAEIGMGATISKLSKSKNNIIIVYFNTGLDARGRQTKDKHEDMTSSMKRSCKILGVKKYHIENFPDNQFDTIPLLMIIKTVEKYLEKYDPVAVYTHSTSELNIDHQIIHRAVITACRPTVFPNIKKLLCFSVPETTINNPDVRFMPNFYEILTADNMAKKISSLNQYESELREYPHPRSELGIMKIAERDGIEVNCEYAERFEIARWIND